MARGRLVRVSHDGSGARNRRHAGGLRLLRRGLFALSRSPGTPAGTGWPRRCWTPPARGSSCRRRPGDAAGESAQVTAAQGGRAGLDPFDNATPSGAAALAGVLLSYAALPAPRSTGAGRQHPGAAAAGGGRAPRGGRLAAGHRPGRTGRSGGGRRRRAPRAAPGRRCAVALLRPRHGPTDGGRRGRRRGERDVAAGPAAAGCCCRRPTGGAAADGQDASCAGGVCRSCSCAAAMVVPPPGPPPWRDRSRLTVLDGWKRTALGRRSAEDGDGNGDVVRGEGKDRERMEQFMEAEV